MFLKNYTSDVPVTRPRIGAKFGHKVSPETRRKISASMKLRPRPEGFTVKGLKWSEERKRLWGERQRGLKRKPHTFEARKKMSTACRSRCPVPKTDESQLARHRFEYKQWREAVYRRDQFKCRKCGCGGRLQPHHIQNFAEHPHVRFCVDNGATLCVLHHKTFHKLFGKKRNTVAQFEEFISGGAK